MTSGSRSPHAFRTGTCATLPARCAQKPSGPGATSNPAASAIAPAKRSAKNKPDVPGREPAPRVPEGVDAVRIDAHATRDGVEDDGVLGHERRLGGDVVLTVLGRGDDELTRPRAQHAPDLFGPLVRGLARRVQGVDERPCPIAPVSVGEDERDLAGRARLRLHGHRRGPRSHLLEGHAVVQPVAQPRGPVVGVRGDASSERCPRVVVAFSPVRADQRGGMVLSRRRAWRSRGQPEQGCERHDECGEREGSGRHGVRPRPSRAAWQTTSLPPCRLASAPSDRSRSRA